MIGLVSEAIDIAPSIKKYDTEKSYGHVTDEELDRNQYTRWKIESKNILVELAKRDSATYGELVDELHKYENSRYHSSSILVHRLMILLSTAKSLSDSPLLNLSQSTNTVKLSNKSDRKVFIVHGHDEGAREAVARFLEKLDLIPIILHEQANEGKTIIEKLEANSDVDFAVVLLTPDDVGSIVLKKENLNQRARQNVIFELGFFIAQLGRPKVAALVKGNIELPSDQDGVLYIKIDQNEGWKFKVAKELKASGLAVDLNNM